MANEVAVAPPEIGLNTYLGGYRPFMQGGRYSGTVWQASDIVQTAAQALRAFEQGLAAEHAVYGLDALDEVALHPILSGGFAQSGLGVWREHPYPGEVSARPILTARERCDLVLTADPAAPPLDPVVELKHMDAATGTLFEPIADTLAPPGPTTEPGDCCWVEVKAIAQFAYQSGVPVPNRAYATELVSGPATDAIKIAREPMINHAMVLIVLFTADEATAAHDIAQMTHRCLDKGAPVGVPAVESFEIVERAGNQVCTVAALPVRL
ncbi:MAG: hypothetical protein DHS20C14_06170 [Phycisphaeraceae bacterium]|nr:MAG: hypothetical protein DHS20C14_06170 [Phycisphaeraceae bacterium]